MPGNKTSLLVPPLLSTCSMACDPIARRVMGFVSKLVPCRQFGRDHTRYQVQPKAALSVNAGSCQPALGSRAGCSKPGVVTGKPTPPSNPERCGDPTGRSELVGLRKGSKFLPPPVKSISALPEPFHTVTGVLPGPSRPPGELASHHAAVSATTCVSDGD